MDTGTENANTTTITIYKLVTKRKKSGKQNTGAQIQTGCSGGANKMEDAEAVHETKGELTKSYPRIIRRGLDLRVIFVIQSQGSCYTWNRVIGDDLR